MRPQQGGAPERDLDARSPGWPAPTRITSANLRTLICQKGDDGSNWTGKVSNTKVRGFYSQNTYWKKSVALLYPGFSYTLQINTIKQLREFLRCFINESCSGYQNRDFNLHVGQLVLFYSKITASPRALASTALQVTVALGMRDRRTQTTHDWWEKGTTQRAPTRKRGLSRQMECDFLWGLWAEHNSIQRSKCHPANQGGRRPVFRANGRRWGLHTSYKHSLTTLQKWRKGDSVPTAPVFHFRTGTWLPLKARCPLMKSSPT